MTISLWLLIDGYNIVKPSAPPSRRGVPPDAPDPWLHRERMLLLDRLVKHLPVAVHHRTCVVFDAKSPPPDVSDRFTHHEIEVRFAVDYDEADDLIEEMIAGHSAPKQLTVVSSDNRLRTAASRRGATAIGSDEWMDRLLDGHIDLAIDPSKYDEPPSESDSPPGQGRAVDDWLRDFGF